jgi:hypothetical protein
MAGDQAQVMRALDAMRRRRLIYLHTFQSPEGQEVLKDLMNFCRGRPDQTVWDADPRKTDVLIGRNEVWKRIQQHVGLTASQLLVLYSGGTVKPEDLKPTTEPQEEPDNG